MEIGNNKQNQLIENLPDAFAYHQIVKDGNGAPVDYIFLEVNAAFEEMTGLKREEILGKEATEVMTGIEKGEFSWIETYGKVALSGKPVHFEKFSEPLGRWYEVSAYSNEPGYFSVVYRDITKNKETEESLRKSEEEHRHLFETMAQGVIYQAADGQIVSANPAAERTLGLSFEQMQGKTSMDPRWQMTEEDSTPVPGTEHPAMIALRTGQTERKRLEQELSRSEERFHKMLSLVPDLISIHDADMNIVYSNWNGFGAVPEEKRTLYTKCFNTYRGLDQICPNCQAVSVLQSGEAFQKELELFEGMWVDLRVIPILGEDHTVEFFVEWVRDITERIITEKEIIAQQKLLEGIMDNVSDVLSIQYPDHSIERYNRAGYELLGMTPEEVRGKKCYQLTGRTRECEECATGRALQSGKLEQIERYFPELGIHLNCRANPVFEDGKIVWVVQHLMDITERKKTEEALKLQASERAAVDAFTNSVSHDMQAPLRRIEGFSEALLEECPDELSNQARDYLERITRQVDSMKTRTDALLMLSRVVSHGITREEVNLSFFARSYLEKLYYAEPDRLAETVVKPKMLARGDVKLLSVVLENLLHNAWKSTVSVEKAHIECGSILKDGRTVYYVRDNGVGFDQQRADEIFDPFKKLHSEADYPGIGIGLNLVYRIITRHGGEIWAEGEEGKGACFYFTLP